MIVWGCIIRGGNNGREKHNNFKNCHLLLCLPHADIMLSLNILILLSELMQSIVMPDPVLSILQASSYFILTAILQG